MLRDEVLSYQSDNNCNDANGKNKLLIRLPVSVGESLNSSYQWLDLFSLQQFDTDDTNDYLYIKIYPGYTQENDIFGEGKLKNTFSSPAVYHHSTTRRGFKAVVTDRRRLILDIVRSLVEISRTSSYNSYSPIKVIDYCLPEAGEEHTIRYGAVELSRLPGLRQSYLVEDWEFTFKEARLRNI